MFAAIRWFIVVFASISSPVLAADFHVGPGQAYAGIGDVPWESLSAGDTVLIHARPAPYTEKWVINRAGTPDAPVTVRGAPDANGALPVILGEGATTRPQLNYWNEERGILKIGGSNSPPDGTPAHIVVENLHFRRARGAFSGRNGSSAYSANAAAIYVEKGNHITIRDCVLEDNGNGLFVAGATTNVLVEGNHIFGNGNINSYYEHNTYTESQSIIYQFNRFGRLCDGCQGNNLKDRSSGTVIRYNWIEGGNRQLDLVDAEGNPQILADPAYQETFVYGNILIEPDGDGNSQIAHFGGDSGETGGYRGALYFWNNTVVSTRVGNTTLLRLSTNNQTADVRNNIIYVTDSGNRLALSNSAGTLLYGWNFFKPGFVASHSPLTGAVTDIGGNVTGTSPGFLDEATQNFHLMATSPARDAAGALPAVVAGYPLDREYLKHQSWAFRPSDTQLDMGAFEYSAGGGAGKTLTVSFIGTGSGVVTSDPAGIVANTNTSHQFTQGANVNLYATPAEFSLFNGWSGACSGAGACSLTMNVDKSVTASFIEDTAHRVRIGDTANYFQTLQAAYNEAPSGACVKAWNASYYEDLSFSMNKEISLKGGYNQGYTSNSGYTVLHGILRILKGTVTVENLIIM
jgi:hypothetical protein